MNLPPIPSLSVGNQEVLQHNGKVASPQGVDAVDANVKKVAKESLNSPNQSDAAQQGYFEGGWKWIKSWWNSSEPKKNNDESPDSPQKEEASDSPEQQNDDAPHQQPSNSPAVIPNGVDQDPNVAVPALLDAVPANSLVVPANDGGPANSPAAQANSPAAPANDAVPANSPVVPAISPVAPAKEDKLQGQAKKVDEAASPIIIPKAAEAEDDLEDLAPEGEPDLNDASGINPTPASIVAKSDLKVKWAMLAFEKYFGMKKSDVANGLANRKKEMAAHLNDPQFVEFYELSQSLLFPIILKAVKNEIKKNVGEIKEDIDCTTLENLLQLVLARVFSTLALRTKEKKGSIDGFEAQPSLVKILSYLCHVSGNQISLDSLLDIEKKYRSDRAKYVELQQKLFPRDQANYIRLQQKLFPKADPNNPILVKKYSENIDLINEYVNAQTIPKKLNNIKLQLFKGPKTQDINDFIVAMDSMRAHALIKEYAKSQTESNRLKEINLQLFKGKESQDIKGFTKMMDEMRKRDGELSKIFNSVTEKIFTSLFPNDLKDIPEVSGFLVTGFFTNGLVGGSCIYNPVKSIISDLFQETYESMENDTNRIDGWKKDLKDRIDSPDLTPILEVPSALMLSYAKNAIQSDPNVIKLASSAINELLHPSSKNLDEQQKTEQFLNSLSHEPLAALMVKSAQALLHTSDPNLSGFGSFINQGMNNLTLAIVAKCVKLAIGENEKQIDSLEFFKEMSDRCIKKFSSYKSDQPIPEEFWDGFVDDLPIPPLAKGSVISYLKSFAEDGRKKIKDTTFFTDLQKMHADVQAKVLSYEGGKQVISMAEKTCDKIVQTILEKNGELTSMLGVQDKFEQLLGQYLPNNSLDDNLKAWIKDNINALGNQGGSSQAVSLIKKGLQTVLLKALVNTVEKNLNNNGKDHIPQLLKNCQIALSKTFNQFDANERKKIDAALAIKEKIDQKNAEIQKIKDSIAKKPDGISQLELSSLEEAIQAKTMLELSEENVSKLQEKREGVLAALNQGKDQAKKWSLKEVLQIPQTIALRKKETSHPLASQAADLKDKIAHYTQIPLLDEGQQKDLAKCRTLLKLLEMTPEDRELISELLNTNETIENAQKETQLLKQELQDKKNAVSAFPQNYVTDSKAWNDAKAWLDTILSEENNPQLLSKKSMQLLTKEIFVLEKELDDNLETFQKLSGELMGLFGLEDKASLGLPPLLSDFFWPYIEQAKKTQIARLLFNHTSPLLIAVTEIDANKDKVTKIFNNNPAVAKLVNAFSKQVINRIPAYFTSYKPFAAQMLNLIGVPQPVSDADVTRMETSFKNTIITLGKGSATDKSLLPLVKGQVPEDQEQAFAANLAALISKMNNTEVSKADVLSLLPKNGDAQQKEIQAQILATNINYFLFNHGKASLTTDDLLEAYQKQVAGNQKLISSSDQPNILKKLNDDGLVGKIKNVFISPEEISQTLNDFIPGISELITPHIQYIITNKDDSFKDSRDFLQKCVEGLILSLLVKIGQANKDPNQKGDLLTTLTDKFIDKALNAQQDPNASVDNTAQDLIEEFLKNVLCIDPNDKNATNIPLALQQMAFKKIYQLAQKFAAPLESVIIEKNQNKEALKKKSGSNFLPSLCQALSKDIIAKKGINLTKEEISKFIGNYGHLDAAAQNDLSDELLQFIDASKAVANGNAFASSYLEGVLLKVFIRIAEKNPPGKGKDTLITITEKFLKFSTQKYQEVKSGEKKIEQVTQEINDFIMKDLLCIDSPDAFIGLPKPLQEKIYDMIKDLIGKSLLSTQKSLATLENGQSSNDSEKEKAKAFGIGEGNKGLAHLFAEDLSHLIMTSVPHILSEDMGFENIKGVTLLSKTIEGYLEDLAHGNVEAAKVLLQYTKTDQAKQILGNNLTQLGDKNQFVDDKKKGEELLTNVLLKPINRVIEKTIDFENQHKKELNQELMTKLLQLGAGHLKNLNAAKELAAQDKRKDIQYQDFVKATGNQLHAGMATAAPNYQETLEAIGQRLFPSPTAKEKALWEKEKVSVIKLIRSMVKDEKQGVKVIRIEEFITNFAPIYKRVTGRVLTPVQRDLLSKPDAKGMTIRKLMRKETEASEVKRKTAHAPTIKAIMDLIFPNGEKDLTFVPEDLRKIIWTLLEKNLFTMMMQTMTEVVFEPNTIRSMVLGSLESLNANLSGPIDVNQLEQPLPEGMDALDEVAGDLIVQSLKGMSLPSWAKKFLVDPKTGAATPHMKKVLGSTLRNKFNDTFLKDMMKLSIEKLVSKDSKGQPFMNFDTISKKEKLVGAIKKSKELDAQLKKASRRTIDSSISYFIKSRWALAQKRFDNRINKVFGKVGTKIKKGLDIAFRFIFFKIIGNILSFLMWPMKQIVKQIIYQIISLDKNRDRLMSMLTKIPGDQPDGDDHVAIHEDLAFKVADSLIETVNKFSLKTTTVPEGAKIAVPAA